MSQMIALAFYQIIGQRGGSKITRRKASKTERHRTGRSPINKLFSSALPIPSRRLVL